MYDIKIIKTYDGEVPDSGYVQKLLKKYVGFPYRISIYEYLRSSATQNEAMSESRISKFTLVNQLVTRDGTIPKSGRLNIPLGKFEGKKYVLNVLQKGWKDYVDLKDVKTIKIEWPHIQCPGCGREMDIEGVGITGLSLRQLKEDRKYGRNLEIDVAQAKNYADNMGYFLPCWNCGFIFPAFNQKEMQKYRKVKEIEALICPLCNTQNPKVPHISDIGYSCIKCGKYLEYTDYPHHGSGDVKVFSTSDYFYGKCPNCKIEEKYGKMTLGSKIWVEDGKVVLPLECQECGYRDTVKISTSNHRRPEIHHEP